MRLLRGMRKGVNLLGYNLDVPTIEREAAFWSRFWSRVKIPEEGGCWEWTGGVQWNGYGAVSHLGHHERPHRALYERYFGKIPPGLTIDHTCHVAEKCKLTMACPHRRCLNPAHLEAVTMKENLLRGNTFQARNTAKTHCARGHPYDEANTKYNKWHGGLFRSCRACHRIARRQERVNHRLARVALKQQA